MAPIKRKIPTGTTDGAHSKKPKRGAPREVKPTPSKRLTIAEAETDSDPIIESDTTSQSGENDGVSWPSEQEDDDDAEAGSFKEGKVRNDDVKVAGQVALLAEPKPPVNNPLGICAYEEPKFHADNFAASTSRESHAKQKATAQERKAAKPNADSIARSKQLWEKLRRKSHVPLEERKKLLTELFGIITGRVKDFVFKHDSVRVIQTALKYANLERRKSIAKELKGEYKALAESKYAKFLLGKILVHGDDEIRDLLVPEFYGHVRRMIKHPEASWILDDVYRGAATPSQKATLLREWYGAEFALFKANSTEPISADLKELLEESPEKRSSIMRSLFELINLLIQKKTTGFTMLHDAMLQYFLNLQAGSERAIELTELLKGDEEGDLLKNLAFTKSGACLVCFVLAYASAKDRKLILRAFKGTIQMMAYDSNAHQVLLTAYDVIDDTVLVAKSIFPELLGKNPESESQQQELLNAVNNVNARVPLLYLFSGKWKSLISNRDIILLDEIHSIRTTTSKKDPAIRRKELISHLSSPLISLITSHAQELVATNFGCQFITEVLLNATGDRHAAIVGVADLVEKDRDIGGFLHSPAAGRMLKALVQGGRFNIITKSIEPVEPPLGFHNIFYEKISEELVEWATGSNSFVIVSLLEAPGFLRVEEVKKRLENSRSRLDEAAGSGGNVKAGKSKKVKVKDKEDKQGSVKGNVGARILLEKLDE
ncbi:MAG: hypothetical protein Q9217_002922 [Psora testacea]